MSPEPPIICTLTPAELAARRADLLPGLAARAIGVESLSDGIRLEFTTTEGILIDLARAIEAERRCCRFLTFALTAAPDLGQVSLEIRGPAGTAAFLSSLIDRAQE